MTSIKYNLYIYIYLYKIAILHTRYSQLYEKDKIVKLYSILLVSLSEREARYYIIE